MSLNDMIGLARRKNPRFDTKMVYWVSYRGKMPDLEWVMPQLEAVLGKEFVENSAQEELERQEKESLKIHDLPIALGV